MLVLKHQKKIVLMISLFNPLNSVSSSNSSLEPSLLTQGDRRWETRDENPETVVVAVVMAKNPNLGFSHANFAKREWNPRFTSFFSWSSSSSGGICLQEPAVQIWWSKFLIDRSTVGDLSHRSLRNPILILVLLHYGINWWRIQVRLLDTHLK
ncbi:hypothetical protein ACFX2I_017186 [Malus domestica]